MTFNIEGFLYVGHDESFLRRTFQTFTPLLLRLLVRHLHRLDLRLDLPDLTLLLHNLDGQLLILKTTKIDF